MTTLYATLERAGRAVLVLFGVANLGLGRLFWEVRENQEFFPSFWPWWFLVAGIVTLTFAVRMHSRALMMASGTLMVVGFASRVGALIVTSQVGDLRGFAPANYFIGSIIWGFAAVATAFIWVFAFRTLAEFRRNL